MKKQYLLGLGIMGALVFHSPHAKTPTTTVDKSVLATYWRGVFKDYNLSAMYSYRNFTFDSTKGDNYNRYHGHTNLYGIGGNALKLSDTLTFGLLGIKSNTSLQSSLSVGTVPDSITDQVINSKDQESRLIFNL